MVISTTMDVPGREIAEILGVVQGNSVRARAIGRDLVASLRNLVGGEIPEYAALLGQAREEALDRMRTAAEQLGADAVVGVRYNTADVMQGVAELLAYGTAVRLR
jgi:uncharacterized protein YbjQ (UPF0145 family)